MCGATLEARSLVKGLCEVLAGRRSTRCLACRERDGVTRCKRSVDVSTRELTDRLDYHQIAENEEIVNTNCKITINSF